MIKLAAALARKPYVAPPKDTGAAEALDYDAWHRVAFLSDRALWAAAGLDFRADYFPTGYIFPTPVQLFEVQNGHASPINFSADDFRVPPEYADAVAKVTGTSGFRVQSPINQPDKFDEIAVFQGASYFRSLGRDEGYGISARGLAIGTDSNSEEFPIFRAFWIERPAVGADSIVLHALLDGASVAGAYRFVITPGDRTVFDVEATLFARRTVRDAGIAAASSMFLFGPADRSGFDDFRAAVHDSDGLEVWSADDRRVWRPLINPAQLQHTRFEGATPKGFGLMQRARTLDAFGDLQARYDRRPSLWVEPVGDWGAGAVQLMEIPTRTETMDNIVAFWRPEKAWAPGQPQTYAYRLHWGQDHPVPSALAQVIQTRVGETIPAGARQFVIDFAGLSADLVSVKAELTTSAGKVGPVVLSPFPGGETLRAGFRFEPPTSGTADLELRLAGDAGDLSETWRFRWTA